MIGKTISHYCILEKIGAGGTGEVYRAHDQELDRDVALKVLPAGMLADEAARKRFRKEALALAKLNHPNIETITSKYDHVQAGTDQFTPQEKLGYELFRGKARCNECHRDGGPGEESLFTDFTLSNLSVPRNPGLQIYYEGRPDQRGYTPNPAGDAYVDKGVGSFLRTLQSDSGQLNPDSEWIKLAPKFDAKFQVATLRNVDMRPRPDFVKAYMHNGYFKRLKEVLHFYNTRDVLPKCAAGDPGEKVTCWPVPEDSTNLNKRQLGNLKLTDQEEDALVSFLTTLTDGYKVPNPRAAK